MTRDFIIIQNQVKSKTRSSTKLDNLFVSILTLFKVAGINNNNNNKV